MSDQPVTVAFLAQFHRDVILPDVERLETQYEAIKLGLGRLEHRLDRMETER